MFGFGWFGWFGRHNNPIVSPILFQFGFAGSPVLSYLAACHESEERYHTNENAKNDDDVRLSFTRWKP